MKKPKFNKYRKAAMLLPIAVGGMLLSNAVAAQCNRTVSANVVAFDMPLMWNRLGATNINGMMYALQRDVVTLNDVLQDPADPNSPVAIPANTPLSQVTDISGLGGNVTLRPDKRPRPLVLRSGAGDCIAMNLTNLLTPQANPFNPVQERSGIPFNLLIDDQPTERRISLRFTGTENVNSINDDGSFVGQNASSLAAVGETRSYTFATPTENGFVGSSLGGVAGTQGLGGTTGHGLWAVLNVGPANSAAYRSQLTREEMDLATIGTTADGHPILNYEATYPNVEPWVSEGKAGLPIVNMVGGGEIVHSDINGVIAYGPSLVMAPAPDGPYAGRMGHFATATYPLESVGKRNPTVPNRLEPFRDFTVAFHDESATKQAFPLWFEDPILLHTLHGVRDAFMINYGSGGIGTEIIAARLGVGPMHDCINCAYEEFFLTAYTVGDVGMLVDVPANVGLEDCAPTLAGCEEVGPKANYALFPDDPSNVHHSYTGDFVKFRNIHAGPGEQHVFHLHNHQWLWNANDDNSNYLDAQGIGPGAGYTYEINFGGSGNRNLSTGDAIFHCHFYPHFAQGMWEMWRNHDVFEHGTELATTVNGGGAHTSFAVNGLGLGDGTPAAGARALPDGEILVGTPIPALVPLPGKPMAPMPAPVTVKLNPAMVAQIDPATGAVIGQVNSGSLADVTRVDANGDGQLDTPGYPFFLAGMEFSVGQRPTTPPLDMITGAQASALAGCAPLWSHPGFTDADAIDGWDGGLPRFTLGGKSLGGIAAAVQNRLDFSYDVLQAKPFFYAEEGTDLEQAAMAYHAVRCHSTFLSDGTTAACDANDLGGYILNGQPPVPGAPFHEPCIDDQGDLLAEGVIGDFYGGGALVTQHDPAGMTVTGASPHTAVDPRYYKAANVQFDAVFNKLGYHFPQERIIALWQDVVPTVEQRRPPEPFVMRANTFDCVEFTHSNVVPKAYELDDFQVRTPTDIIGQHIHLPKWDLTTTDGAANGWNYEDGTLSPEAVVEIIEAINHWNTVPGNSPVTTMVDGSPVVASDGHSLTASGTLEPADHPFFGNTPFALQWKGARSTLQRWFVDPVVNVQGVDRGLGIIFTHDHYGPSTHQQIGLYATLLIEPAGSKWVHNETGTQLNLSPDGTSPAGRIDGGPTSWQAAILTGSDGFGDAYTQNVGGEIVENHREFYFEYSDFQSAYQPGVFVGTDVQGFPIVEHDIHNPWSDANLPPVIGAASIRETFRDAIGPSNKQQAELVNGFPVDVNRYATICIGGAMRPCPEAISADDPGMYVTNYRNESLIARVYDPNKIAVDGKPGTQADGRGGDFSFAMQTRTDRAIPELNTKLGLAPAGYAGDPMGEVFLPPINNVNAMANGDAFTPMMRTYDGDRVHVKVQAGGHEEEHGISLHGLKWLQAGSGFGEAKNSGWRNTQNGGISEQFSLRTPVTADLGQRGRTADYLYTTNTSLDGWTSGVWGVMRSYDNQQGGNKALFALPGNDPQENAKVVNKGEFKGVCPKAAPVVTYDITAVLANDALPANPNVTVQDLFPGAHEGASPNANGGTLVYNDRTDSIGGQTVVDPETGEVTVLPTHQGPLHAPTAILYVHTNDLVGGTRRLKPGVALEPVVIRAAAGDCIQVTLRNRLRHNMPDLPSGNFMMGVVRRDRDAPTGMTTFQNNLMVPSKHVGLHPALVEYDISRADGNNVGINKVQTAAPGKKVKYTWYAGDLTYKPLAATGKNKNRRNVELVATPIEFGGFNILPSDMIEQGQKGLMGAGAIYPQGSTWTVDAGTTTVATVTGPNGTFRDFSTIAQKGANFYYADSFPTENLLGEGSFGVAEDSQDMGHMTINYGTEPLWFRFGLLPNSPAGNAGNGSFGGVANAGDMYSNGLVGQDPQTAVFTAAAGTEFRMHVLMPFAPGRGSTFDLHGHAWQRDPYVCEGSADLGLAGKCDMGNGHAGTPGTGEVGSTSIGHNPIGFGMGGIESWSAAQHYEVVIPSAGGANGVGGDFLFRDHMGLGNHGGLWGIVRVTGGLQSGDATDGGTGEADDANDGTDVDHGNGWTSASL